MRKPIVLFCSPAEVVPGNNPGGINIWTQNILKQYESEKEHWYSLELFSTSRKSYIHEKTNILKRLYRGIIEYSSIVLGIDETISTNKYDILHLSSSASLGLIRDYFILKSARKNDVASIIHFHFGRIPQLTEKNNWEWKLLKKICKLAAKVVVMDTPSLNTLYNHGINKALFIPNPVSQKALEVFHENSEKCNIRKILFVGHVTPAKGILELLEAVKNIQNIELNLIGEIENQFKQDILTQYNRPSWLKIHGVKPYKTVINEMCGCDLFVLPSHTEGFPNVILEAMACKCPIVATSVGAIPEMLDSKTDNPCGLIVPPKDAIKLKNAIKRTLEDLELSNRIAANAFEKVHSCYSAATVYRQLEDLWSSCINKLN